jgi:hypothetical protein
MDEEKIRPTNLLDTTDCLEAIGVFRGWKNFLFIVVILCLLLLQVSFWLVDRGYIKAEGDTQKITPAVVTEGAGQVKDVSKQAVAEKGEIDKAAKQVAAEPNQPAKAAAQEPPKQAGLPFGIKFKHLSLLVRFVDFVLVITAVLYCLTMLFALKVSLLGRLGGINHISRAFFLSLVMLVLLLPWQKFFPGVVAGAIYTPAELLSSCSPAVAECRNIFGTAFYYFRFVGLWLLVLLFLIFSQFRSARWAKAILRRLEVI